MNPFNKIARASAVIAAASLFSVAHATATDPTPFNQEIVRLGHTFELANGENLTLSHRHRQVAYRICVEEAPGIVPLDLVVDGKKMAILDGTCADVVGAHISVKPSEKLPRDSVMVGRFETVKK